MTDEVLGIAPGPEHMETLLDAYDIARNHEDHLSGQYNKPEKIEILYYRRVRQRKAFRARILRLDERNQMTIQMLREKIETLEMAIVHQRKEAQDGD